MPTRKRLGSSKLTEEEREFVDQGNPAGGGENRSEGTPGAIITVPEGFRMRLELRHRLRLACAHRKNETKSPWTKQDIFNEAVEEWLASRGH